MIVKVTVYFSLSCSFHNIGDPTDTSIKLRPLEPASGQALARDLVLKTRRRKGLGDQIAVSKYLDDEFVVSSHTVFSHCGGSCCKLIRWLPSSLRCRHQGTLICWVEMTCCVRQVVLSFALCCCRGGVVYHLVVNNCVVAVIF